MAWIQGTKHNSLDSKNQEELQNYKDMTPYDTVSCVMLNYNSTIEIWCLKIEDVIICKVKYNIVLKKDFYIIRTLNWYHLVWRQQH